MSKKVFKGWCSRKAKASEFLFYSEDVITRPEYGWAFYKFKTDCQFDKDHMPPRRVTITVEVED